MSKKVEYNQKNYEIFIGDEIGICVREVGSEKKEDIFLSVCFKSMDYLAKVATIVISNDDEKEEEILLGDNGKYTNKYGDIGVYDRGAAYQDNNNKWLVSIKIGV